MDIDPLVGSYAFSDTVKILDECSQIDFIITHTSFDIWSFARRDEVIKFYTDAVVKLQDEVKKPLVVVLHAQVTEEAKRLASQSQSELRRAGLPVYYSLGQAANALNKYLWYHEWLAGQE